jgi:hypothetical protein
MQSPVINTKSESWKTAYHCLRPHLLQLTCCPQYKGEHVCEAGWGCLCNASTHGSSQLPLDMRIPLAWRPAHNNNMSVGNSVSSLRRCVHLGCTAVVTSNMHSCDSRWCTIHRSYLPGLAARAAASMTWYCCNDSRHCGAALSTLRTARNSSAMRCAAATVASGKGISTSSAYERNLPHGIRTCYSGALHRDLVIMSASLTSSVV